MLVEAKLEELGLVLPGSAKPPPGVRLSFAWVRGRGDRAYLSGHGPLNPDGSPAGPFGKVGTEVSLEEGYEAARLAALSMLGSLKREVGDLDRVGAWLAVNGMVNVAPDFRGTTNLINGFSDLILISLRSRSRDARSHGRWDGRAAARAPGHDRRGGRNTKLMGGKICAWEYRER